MTTVTVTAGQPVPAADAATAAAADRTTRSGRTAVALASTAVLFVALELTIIAVAMPDIAASFPDSTRATRSWVFTAYNVGVAALLLIGGWLAERFGRRRVFVTGLLVFTAGSLASGLAPSLESLIAARAAQAVGGALLVPASLAVVLQAVPAERRDAAIGLWGAMAGLAAAVGPTLGAVLVASAGWRAVFLVNVVPALAVALAAHRRLPESADPDIERGVDLVAVPAGAAAVGLAVFVIVAGGTLGWTSPPAIGCVAAAVALLALFAHRTRRHPRPVFEPAIATTRTFAAGSLGTLLFVAGFTGWLVFVPVFLTELWGYSTLQAGLAMSPGPLAMAVTARPAGRAAARIGHAKVITLGAGASLCAVAWWVIRLGPDPAYLSDLLPGSILLGVGVGAGFPMLTAVALADVDPSRYAMGAAGATTVRQLAMAVGIAVATAIVGAPDRPSVAIESYRSSWLACGALFLGTAVAMTLLPEATRHGQEEVATNG